jgi:hypothetical protein
MLPEQLDLFRLKNNMFLEQMNLLCLQKSGLNKKLTERDSLLLADQAFV